MVLDAWVETNDSNGHFFVWETIIVVPTSGLKLPNFDLVPRRETGGMNFLGVEGLDLLALGFAAIGLFVGKVLTRSR